MKKAFIILVTSMFSASVLAQQKPYYTQYILNNYILNPGFAGIENYTDAKFSYRKQWSDLDGAPVTTYLTLHKPIGKSDSKATATSLQVPSSNSYQTYDGGDIQPHHGAGVTFISDKTGYITRSTFAVTYAYHKPVTRNMQLSVGFNAGFTNVNLDRTKIVWGSLDPNDPAIGYGSGDLRKVMPELGAGIVLYDSSFFFGASVLNIVPGKVRFVKTDVYGDYFKPHAFFQAGYKFYLTSNLSLIPSVAVQMISPLPPFIHVNAKMYYDNVVWIGAGYRLKDELSGLAAVAGVNLARTLNISYSYNNTVNKRLQTYVGNTHEVVLGVMIGKKSDSCPRNIW